jgi:hypothetical protein
MVCCSFNLLEADASMQDACCCWLKAFCDAAQQELALPVV